MGLFDDPGPTPQEQALLDQQLALTNQQIERDEKILAELAQREKVASTTIQRANQAAEAGLITTAQATTIRENQVNILTGFQERTLNLLRGEGPVDPGFERDVSEEEQRLRQRLVKQLGPDYENTSSGRRALQRFFESVRSGRAERRRVELFGSSAEARDIQGLFGQQQAQSVTIADLFARSPGLFQQKGFQTTNIGMLGTSLDRLSAITAREQQRQAAGVAGLGKAVGIGAALALAPVTGGLSLAAVPAIAGFSAGGTPPPGTGTSFSMPTPEFRKAFPKVKF